MEKCINRRNAEERRKFNQITGAIVDAAVKVHMQLGPGLLEHVYQKCLVYELKNKGLDTQSEVYLPIVYDSQIIDNGYRLDILVESEIIVELKSVTEISNLHKSQLLTYLKLTKKSVGLLLNFNVSKLPSGIYRLVNNY